MRGTSSLFFCFLSKFRTKGGISDIIWANNPYTTATIFTKCNVFYARYMAKTWVFTHINWKRTECEISDRNWANTQYTRAIFFTKCNVFLLGAWSLAFFSKNTRWELRQKLSKIPKLQGQFVQNVTFLW